MDFLKECSDEGTLDVPTTGTAEHKSFFATSLTVSEPKGLTKKSLEAFFYHLTSSTIPGKYFIIINLHGGPRSAVNHKDSSFSAYADRDSLWTFQIRGDSDSQESKAFVTGVRDKIISAQPESKFGASLSYIDAELEREEAWKAYYCDADVLERLKMLKEKLDPHEMFWNPHSITKPHGR